MKVYLKNVTSSDPPKIVNNGECALERNVVRFHTDKYLDGKKNFNDGRPGLGSFEYTAKFGGYGNGFNTQITVIGDNNVLGNVYYCNVTYWQRFVLKWWLKTFWVQRMSNVWSIILGIISLCILIVSIIALIINKP